MLWEIGIIAFLLLLSALFSASETAILSVSSVKLHKLKSEGDKKASVLWKLREDKEGLIGAILLGNNFVNTAASSIATGVTIAVFGDKGSVLMIVTLVMTMLILVLSEVMPKTYAVRNSEFVALHVAPLVNMIKHLLLPIVVSVRFIVNNILKLVASNSRDIHISAMESIKSTIDIHHQEGEVVTDYKYMLSGVIELAEVVVKEVMVHRNECFSINAELSPEEIITTSIHSPYSRIPLWRDNPDNVIAVLHVKDISKIMIIKQSFSQITHQDIMSACRKPWFIPSTTTLNNQLLAFKDRHLHFALAVNEYGDLEGIVTLEDILEEVVGHIEDEHDIVKNAELKIHLDGSVIAGGNVSIRDLNRAMQWDLNDGHVHTIGGLLFHVAQGVPELGRTFIYDNFSLKLIKKSKNKILKVKVSMFQSNAVI